MATSAVAAETTNHWAFQPPSRPDLPRATANPTADHRIDRFVHRETERAGLETAPELSDQAFLRRTTFLLTGLPPSVKDLSFEKDDQPLNHRDRLTDRLLASYAYGERFASFWLPLARYAEDQAHQVGNNTSLNYPNAHLYRQWVIDAFNRDLPYGDFIRWQLAADFYEGVREREVDALGFLGIGPKYYNRGRLDVMADEWEDRVDTVSRTFLGLTVACARCHDHKYDPISAQDYHALAGVFASTDMLNKPLAEAAPAKKGKKDKKEGPETARHIVKEGKIQDLPVFIRGDVESKGDVVPRRFLTVLSDGEPKPFTDGSGRRELAEAITDPSNPLTSRVMVNRLWKEVFGHGLTRTPSNFGILGEKPTHPELLDDLALEFQSHGSIKRLLKAMLSTATYQRSASYGDAKQTESDPANRWLARGARRRLTFEMWRDALLAASESLNPQGGVSSEIEDPQHFRRTLYSRISRLDLNDVLEQFDYPDPNVHASSRTETTTASQKLYLLNHPFMIDQADRLSARATETDDPIGELYRRLVSRTASSHERARAERFLKTAGSTGLAQLAQVLMCSNEMLYLD